MQRIVYAANEANYCATCQTGGRLLADRSLSRLLREDWPRTLEELERRRTPPRPLPNRVDACACRRRHRVRPALPRSLAAQEPSALRYGGDAEGGAPFMEADPNDPSRVVGFEVDSRRCWRRVSAARRASSRSGSRTSIRRSSAGISTSA